MNTAIVKRSHKSLDVGNGPKSLLRKRRRHSGHYVHVDQPVVKCVDDGSGDSAVVQCKHLCLEPFESVVSHTSATTSVVPQLVSIATQSANGSVLHVETESASNVISPVVPCTSQITSHTVVSNVSGTAVVTSTRPKVTEPWNRRVQHLKFSTGPVTSAECVASATECDRRHAEVTAGQPTHTQTNDTASAQQNTITDGIYLLWQNEDSLCWLDVAMALIVNCESLHGVLKQFGKDSCLSRLLTSFNDAQVNYRRSRKLYRCHYLCGQGKAVTLETSVGQVTVKTGGGHGPVTTSLLGGASTVTASIDLDDISGIVSADDPHSASVEKVSQEAKRLEDKAKQLLVQTRNEVFESLQPTMHCKRGECDSVLIALTEILSLDEAVRSFFTVRYTYSLSCTSCGQPESGK